MKPYIATTGTAFGLLVLAHVARMFEEGTHLLREPVFVISTVIALFLCIWAITLLTKRTHHDT